MNKNEAKVAVAGMELWMGVTHAGDVRRIRCYLFFCLKRNLLREDPSLQERSEQKMRTQGCMLR